MLLGPKKLISYFAHLPSVDFEYSPHALDLIVILAKQALNYEIEGGLFARAPRGALAIEDLLQLLEIGILSFRNLLTLPLEQVNVFGDVIVWHVDE